MSVWVRCSSCNGGESSSGLSIHETGCPCTPKVVSLATSDEAAKDQGLTADLPRVPAASSGAALAAVTDGHTADGAAPENREPTDDEAVNRGPHLMDDRGENHWTL